MILYLLLRPKVINKPSGREKQQRQSKDQQCAERALPHLPQQCCQAGQGFGFKIHPLLFLPPQTDGAVCPGKIAHRSGAPPARCAVTRFIIPKTTKLYNSILSSVYLDKEKKWRA